MHCDHFKVKKGKKEFGETNEHTSKAMEVSGHFRGGPFHQILGIPSLVTTGLQENPT